jgi:hypothetical protein|eukprot:COSAG02_NODE_6252_length_3699_cov_1.530556_5_plen_69_part_00
MYYQLSAFADEVRACEALPADQRAKPWTYSLKPSPVSTTKASCNSLSNPHDFVKPLTHLSLDDFGHAV